MAAEQSRIGAGHDRAGHGGGANQRACLAFVHAAQRRWIEGVRLRSCCLQIQRLSARHPARPGGVGDDVDGAELAVGQLRTVEAGGARRRLTRHQCEGLRVERIAGKNRLTLAKHHVRRRPPTPQRVIVHRREIVVHERIGVDQFDCACGGERQLARLVVIESRVRCHGFGGGEDEQRAQPLAASHHAVAHRVGQD